MTFKEKLVILRKAKGLTQDEFAAAVGVSRQAVYKWECGQSYPEVPKLLEMKILFTISIDELLDDNYDIPLPEKKKRKRIPKDTIEKIENNVKKEVKAEAPKKAAPKPAQKEAPVQSAPAYTAPNAYSAPKAAPIFAAPKAAPAPEAPQGANVYVAPETVPAQAAPAYAAPQVAYQPAPQAAPAYAAPQVAYQPAPQAAPAYAAPQVAYQPAPQSAPTYAAPQIPHQPAQAAPQTPVIPKPIETPAPTILRFEEENGSNQIKEIAIEERPINIPKIELEDDYEEIDTVRNDNEDSTKKKGFFGRIFGKK